MLFVKWLIGLIITVLRYIERILCRSKAKKNLKHPELLENYCYVRKEAPMDFISEISTEYLLSLWIVRIEIVEYVFMNYFPK